MFLFEEYSSLERNFPFLFSIIGIIVACFFYERVERHVSPYLLIFSSKMYFDSFYNSVALFILLRLKQVYFLIDKLFLEYFGPYTLHYVVNQMSFSARYIFSDSRTYTAKVGLLLGVQLVFGLILFYV